MRKKNVLIAKVTAIALVAALSIGGLMYSSKSEASSANLVTANENETVNEELKNKISSMILDDNNFKAELDEAKKVTRANKKTYTFKGERNQDIYAESYPVENPKAAIVMMHGFTENIYSFEEMIYYFNKMGYSVYMHEHRGHARSGRLGCDEYQIYVDNFDDYVKDYNTFIETIVKPETKDLDLYGYAHSMGGLVITKYAEMYPNTLKKVVASSPMLGINSGNFPTPVAKIISLAASSTFWGKKYCPGQGPIKPGTDKFEEAGCSSEPRFNELTAAPKIEHPEVCCGAASYKWLSESYKAIQNTLDKKNVAKVKAPILMCKATQDTLVDTKGQDDFAKKASTCTLKVYNTKHEIHKAPNDILETYLYDVLNFYEK